MVDVLRGSMDAAEYKHVVLGLLFLKYVSDSLEESDADDIFSVPRKSRWSYLVSQSRESNIGLLVNDAMTHIENANPSLKDVLPKDYSSPSMDNRRLIDLIEMISDIDVGDKESRSKDMLGRVYEYFLSQFANADGKRGGEFYTPRSIVNLLVEMLKPYHGRVYDPCCGSAGMFVQSMRFIEQHAADKGNENKIKDDISIYGQELNYTTWRLAKMNLAIRGIDGNIKHGDTLVNDMHPDLRADYILANPPFNMSRWSGELFDRRWQYGTPPRGNANFAWMQHMVYHLSPNGVAGIVLANGSMSSNQSNEGEIRKNLIENNLVDCMIALPGQLFYSTQIPVCIWVLARNRNGSDGHTDRRGKILFIDARKLGRMVDRTHRELIDDDVKRVANTYHAWCDRNGKYEDIAGFCKSTSIEDVRKHGYMLTPGRYVGVEAAKDDGEPFQEKMTRLSAQWREQSKEARTLDEEIERNLVWLGF